MRSILVVWLVALPVVGFAQTPESTLQMKLAKDPGFLARLQYVMVQQARVVKAEPLATVCHASRSKYADDILRGSSEVLAGAAVAVVGGTNLLIPNATTTVTPAVPDNPTTVVVNEAVPESVTTSASDAALLSQVASFWSALAGCDTGS